MTAGVGVMISATLWLTFGWVGTLLLNMPGFFFATMLRGHEAGRFPAVMFAGNFLFYAAVIWWALLLRRSFRARAK
jgi:hypothetical protein